MVDEYTALFAPVTWGPVECRFSLLENEPPTHLVSNISIVAFVGEKAVQIELEDDRLEIVGGTLEPGETYREAIERELLEEAGARLLRLKPFGVWHCRSSAPSPYRPHIPHPVFYRLAAYAEIETVGPPQVPEGGEAVRVVHVLKVEEAAMRFRQHGRPELAELYLLAAKMKEVDSKADMSESKEC